MLSAEERRRLDQIERLLEVDDPRFVARMRAGPRPTRRWGGIAAYCLLWTVALVAGVFVDPLVGLCVAAAGALTTAAVVAVATARRRRSQPWTYPWTPPGW